MSASRFHFVFLSEVRQFDIFIILLIQCFSLELYESFSNFLSAFILESLKHFLIKNSTRYQVCQNLSPTLLLFVYSRNGKILAPEIAQPTFHKGGYDLLPRNEPSLKANQTGNQHNMQNRAFFTSLLRLKVNQSLLNRTLKS